MRNPLAAEAWRRMSAATVVTRPMTSSRGCVGDQHSTERDKSGHERIAGRDDARTVEPDGLASGWVGAVMA